MPGAGLVRAAARNNADWCDAFCRTHGIVGRSSDTFWWSPARTPPLYPDAVTLVPGLVPEEVLVAIDTGDGCAVKDSFADLDLAPAGFRPLFRAEWLHRQPAEAARSPDPRWSVLATDGQLREWESAWDEPIAGAPFFRPALLGLEDIRVLARFEGGRIVAGAVASRGGGAVGLGNVFDSGSDLEAAWRGAAASAAAVWPGTAIVGYARGPALDAARRAGFDSIGELIVWSKTDPAS